MDFDKNGWQDAVSAIRTVAKSRGLQASVERSRSGNGGHIWFFFERPISAKLARDFGSALVTEAMRRTKTVKFDAYDRMFPAQTTIPEGGFGNLISLPFQGKAQREGNSVFVDEQFHPYPDQWLFLSHVEKIDEQAAQNAIDSLAANALGDLAEQHPVPWRHQLRESLSRGNFSEPVDIVESDMVYVPESALDAKAADAARRLAAFANPEFYRAQAMHQSVYGKHRVIFLGETRERHIALPRGCKQRLFELLDEVGVRYSYRDERYAGRNISAQFSGILRPEQEHAANQLLRHDNGILSAPTGFGKTVIGAFVIAHLQLSTLVIVPKTALISRWATRLSEFLDIQHPDGPLLTQSGKPSKAPPTTRFSRSSAQTKRGIGLSRRTSPKQQDAEGCHSYSQSARNMRVNWQNSSRKADAKRISLSERGPQPSDASYSKRRQRTTRKNPSPSSRRKAISERVSTSQDWTRCSWQRRYPGAATSRNRQVAFIERTKGKPR